ncbi:MAG: hypothetical protein RLZZ301_206 [Bacteroidota bacterium]
MLFRKLQYERTFIAKLQLSQDDITRIKRQDERFLMRLYHQCFSLLMQVAVRYKNNREEQITLVNNAFLKMVRFIDHFKVNSSFEAWMLAIIRNEIIDDYRRNHKKSSIQYTELVDDVRIDDSALECLQEQSPSALLRHLNALPPATKVVFNLYALDDFSAKEISAQLDISYETVKWHLKHARKLLRVAITQQNQHHEQK